MLKKKKDSCGGVFLESGFSYVAKDNLNSQISNLGVQRAGMTGMQGVGAYRAGLTRMPFYA